MTNPATTTATKPYRLRAIAGNGHDGYPDGHLLRLGGERSRQYAIDRCDYLVTLERDGQPVWTRAWIEYEDRTVYVAVPPARKIDKAFIDAAFADLDEVS